MPSLRLQFKIYNIHTSAACRPPLTEGRMMSNFVNVRLDDGTVGELDLFSIGDSSPLNWIGENVCVTVKTPDENIVVEGRLVEVL